MRVGYCASIVQYHTHLNKQASNDLSDSSGEVWPLQAHVHPTHLREREDCVIDHERGHNQMVAKRHGSTQPNHIR